ncbi:LysE family translocator [soil metagenome]
MLTTLFPMFLFTLAGAISPGPVNLMAASIGANAGFARAMPHVAGASMSYAAIVWLTGSGLHGILAVYPQIAVLLPYTGAAYLLYLSARIATAQSVAALQSPQTRVSAMAQGVLSQSLNPKAWLVAMSGVSLFAAPGPRAPVLLLVFCGISGVVCFFSVALWAALGKLVSRWLARRAYQVAFNGIMALILASSVVAMLLAA